MANTVVVNSWEVKPFVLNESYSSKMLLDDTLSGTKTIQINEGTLKAGCSTPGDKHEDDEIYYIVKGEAVLYLDGKAYDVKPGSLAFIPAGVFHSLENKSKTEDLVLLTFWRNASANEVYDMRIKAWGKSFKTIYED
ncbi:MAG: cupin domain-containing protein [Thermoanaerobacteraceae bacterium]|nr:cupin domain-containing protein [Thermoanaerobacteraceae bacterium]